MTKVIAVLRHAQSAGKQSGQRDYDRTLTPEGEATARIVGKKLSRHGFSPDFILASGATRVKQTVHYLNESLRISERNIQFEDSLWSASAKEWFEQIHQLSTDFSQVLLAGHNPHLSILASTFAGKMTDLAPAQFMVFEFEVLQWQEVISKGRVILDISE